MAISAAFPVFPTVALHRPSSPYFDRDSSATPPPSSPALCWLLGRFRRGRSDARLGVGTARCSSRPPSPFMLGLFATLHPPWSPDTQCCIIRLGADVARRLRRPSLHSPTPGPSSVPTSRSVPSTPRDRLDYSFARASAGFRDDRRQVCCLSIE